MSTYYASALGLGDIFSSVERALLGTRNFTSGALAIGTSKPTVNLIAAVDYCIDGVLAHKAISVSLFTHTDVTVQPAYSTKAYLCCLDISGNELIVQGNLYTTDAAGTTVTSSTGPAKLPPVPAGYCAIGYVKIVTAATTFTPGTSDHDKAACTVTYVNLSCIPTTNAV